MQNGCQLKSTHVILTKYFMCINKKHYMIYLQNMKFERLILWPWGAYTDAMHRFIHESWLHRLIGKYPKWAKNYCENIGVFCRIKELRNWVGFVGQNLSSEHCLLLIITLRWNDMAEYLSNNFAGTYFFLCSLSYVISKVPLLCCGRTWDLCFSHHNYFSLVSLLQYI